MLRALYRCRQALARVRATFRVPDLGRAGVVLSGPAHDLFRGMSRGDQHHGLCVWQEVTAAGDCTPALGQAALLHDVGKSRAHLGLLLRTLVVLLGALDGGLVGHLGGDGSAWWRRPFYVQAHHGEIGALLCARAGCPQMTVDLVRYHESAEECPLDDADFLERLAALRAADDCC